MGLVNFDPNEKNSSFVIISTHLIAFERYFEKRRKQLRQIIENLENYKNLEDPYLPFFLDAINNRNIIIMGDLNLHLQIETMYIYENKFIDLWIETNDEDGFTWDGQRNSLIKIMLPLDNRRMKLDRIIIKEGSLLFSIGKPENEMKIFGREKIKPKRFGSWLVGSDHFGLKISLNVDKDNKLPFKANKSINLDDKNRILYCTGFRTEKKIVLLRVLAIISLVLVILAQFIF